MAVGDLMDESQDEEKKHKLTPEQEEKVKSWLAKSNDEKPDTSYIG